MQTAFCAIKIEAFGSRVPHTLRGAGLAALGEFKDHAATVPPPLADPAHSRWGIRNVGFGPARREPRHIQHRQHHQRGGK